MKQFKKWDKKYTKKMKKNRGGIMNLGELLTITSGFRTLSINQGCNEVWHGFRNDFDAGDYDELRSKKVVWVGMMPTEDDGLDVELNVGIEPEQACVKESFIVNESNPTKAADFLRETYGIMFTERYVTSDRFNDIKRQHGIGEWDYPLEEKDYIKDVNEDLGTKYELVQFADGVMRYCELPEKANTNNIIVVVRGGRVESVYARNENIEVEVLDMDTQDEDELKNREKHLKVIENNKNYKDVY